MTVTLHSTCLTTLEQSGPPRLYSPWAGRCELLRRHLSLSRKHAAAADTLTSRNALRGTRQVILHPKWGSSIYPSSLFTKAPVEDLLQAIKQVEADPVAQAL